MKIKYELPEFKTIKSTFEEYELNENGRLTDCDERCHQMISMFQHILYTESLQSNSILKECTYTMIEDHEKLHLAFEIEAEGDLKETATLIHKTFVYLTEENSNAGFSQIIFEEFRGILTTTHEGKIDQIEIAILDASQLEDDDQIPEIKMELSAQPCKKVLFIDNSAEDEPNIRINFIQLGKRPIIAISDE